MTAIILSVALGIVTWSLMEYCFHRWLGHDKRTRPNFFSVEHTRHHVEGNYFAPPQTKALPAVIIIALVGGASVWIAGWGPGLGYLGGFVGFYLCYEMFHRSHHTHEGFTRYGKWCRRHHFSHHFKDGRYNHGVTSPIWDFVFGTYRRAEKIRVPRKLMMSWLADPNAVEVHSHLQAHYELR